MSSKKRGGLSKREYAAQAKAKAAPKVSSKSSSNSSSNSSYDSKGNYIAPDYGIPKASSNFADTAFGQAVAPSNAFSNSTMGKAVSSSSSSSSNKSSSSKSSSKSKYSPTPTAPNSYQAPTSSRSLAQNAFNTLTGTKTAQASNIVTPKVDKPTGILGSLFMKGIEPLRGAYANVTGGNALPDLGLSEALGLTQKVDGGLTYNTGSTPEVDPTTGNTINPSSPNQVVASTPAPYNNWDTFNQSKGNDSSNRKDTRVSDNRTARPVTNPFQTPTPNTDSWFTPQQKVQYSAPQQDFTPAQGQNSGTQRQFLGNGYLSNGMASNGKGNYGIEGAMTGTDQMESDPMDELLTLLGLKPMTAQASTNFAPQSFAQPQSNFNASPFGQAVASNSPAPRTDFNNNGWSVTKDPTDNPGYQAPRVDNTRIEGAGKGVAQQYAQPENNSLSLMQQQGKGFSAQEKAQKKATDELIKSIKRQYADQEGQLGAQFQNQQNTLNQQYQTQQTQGTSDLEKAKQADLLRLSGLFNFSANQDPDSEQRVQYEQRAQDEANNTLKDFLAKITAAKGTDLNNLTNSYNTDVFNLGQSRNKDTSGAKQQLQTALSQIAQSKSSNQMDIAKLMDSLKQKSSSGSAGVPKSTKPSHNDIFSYVNDAVSQGGTWQEIAEDAKAQGIDTSTGSYLDQLLNRQFRR